MTINCTALTRDIHWNHSTRLPRTNESNASQLRNTENIMIFNNKTLRDTKQYNFTSEKQFINLVSVDKRETFDTSYVSNSILTKMKTEYTQQIVAKYRSLVPLTQQIKKVNTYDCWMKIKNPFTMPPGHVKVPIVEKPGRSAGRAAAHPGALVQQAARRVRLR